MRMNQCIKKIIVIGFLIIFANQISLAQKNEKFEKAWSDLTQYFQTGAKELGIIGASIMFIQNSKIIDSSYYGLADLETKRPVDKNTIYHWASNTKMFTGIAIMQLRDRGLLKLEDPVVDYIPELEPVHNPYGNMNDITIRHLLSHSAGFRAPTWPWKDQEKGWHPHEPTKWEQLVAMFPYTEILFKPGSKYSYSNLGIIFLGRIIELLTGDDYEVYVDKNIFKPLGMHKSYFDKTPYHLLRDRSNSYLIENGKTTTYGLDFDTGITVSNGGLNAPLGDIAKFAYFILGSEEKKEIYEGVLKRSSLEEMWKSEHQVYSNSPYKTSMGLCFFIYEEKNLRLIRHGGDQMGFGSSFYIDPLSKTGWITVFNTYVFTFDKDKKRIEPSDRTLKRGIWDKLTHEILPLFRPNNS